MASEVYFYNLSYKNLFGYICSKNYKQEMLLNTKILTILPILKQHGCDEIRSDLKCALQGSKANLTMLSYLTNPGAKLDALAKLMNLASIASKSPGIAPNHLESTIFHNRHRRSKPKHSLFI